MPTYQIRAEESPSIAIVRAIADAHGIEPINLDACLYDHVDPSALDSLLDESNCASGLVQITFEMANCVITADSSGTVTIRHSMTDVDTPKDTTVPTPCS